MTPDQFVTEARHYGVAVSRETLDKYRLYVDVLQKWNSKINLISRHTADHVWRAHIWDSLQLVKWLVTDSGAPLSVRTHVDLGSGAGFPGLVLSIFNIAEETVLIESDQRKASFLKEIIRTTGASARVINVRIEKCIDQVTDVDLITARALAPLEKLLALSHPLSHADTVYFFPKGQNVDEELTQATKCWIFSVKRFHGVADARTTVLRISDVFARSIEAP